jgi:6-phosphogluconolactonase
MRYRGCIRPALLGRTVGLTVALLAFAATPALAHRHRHNRDGDHGGSSALKAVYTETNNPAGNQVLVFARAADGTIPKEPSQTVSTGGLGLQSQPPFGFPAVDSQGAMDITQDGQVLFAVNAGSNTISSFKVTSSGPQLVSQVSSGGTEPISLTHTGHLLYVLNEASGNVSGFTFSDSGTMTPIRHSTQSIGTPGAGGVSADIAFAPGGRVLTVSERCFQGCSLAPFGLIDTFRMNWDGTPGPVQAHPGDAPIPFGFAYQSPSNLIVTYVGYVSTPSNVQPNPADPNQFNGFVGSDKVNWWAGLTPNGTIPAGGRGTCWIAITADGKYAFITNSLSDTLPDLASGRGGITRLALSPDGKITFLGTSDLTPDAAGPTFPTDLGLSSDGKNLYVASPTLTFGLDTSHIDSYSVSGGNLSSIGATDDSLSGGLSGIVSH